MEHCKICGNNTHVAVFNINLKAVPICEGCAQDIFIQQAKWFVEQDVYKKVKELETTDQLLQVTTELLNEIPECPTHGRCIPHAIEWIRSHKNREVKKTCPHCHSNNVVIFDSDNDLCNDCKKYFPAV